MVKIRMDSWPHCHPKGYQANPDRDCRKCGHKKSHLKLDPVTKHYSCDYGKEKP